MKFAQNAKSIQQNWEENQVQARAPGSDAQLKQFAKMRVMDPSTLRAMMLSHEESAEKRRLKNSSSSQFGDSFLQSNFKISADQLMAQDEIEKLLGSTDFDDQLDANNIKLHRALLLQQLQLKQFQNNTEHLMQKVDKLETILTDNKNALTNTSKFGAAIQMVQSEELDGSRRLKQASMKSASTFHDFMMNSSKLEPTDSSQINLNLSQSFGSSSQDPVIKSLKLKKDHQQMLKNQNYYGT